MIEKFRFRLIELLGGFPPDSSFKLENHLFDDTESTIIMNDPDTKYGDSNNKNLFVERMKKMTKLAAVDLVNLMEETNSSPGINVIRYQVIKSATSTAANYRAACRARSKKEFFAKICIVVEECDETEFWLEMLIDTKVKIDKEKIKKMLPIWTEILRIVSKAKDSTFSRS